MNCDSMGISVESKGHLMPLTDKEVYAEIFSVLRFPSTITGWIFQKLVFKWTPVSLLL